jgi:YD repeat-containing protein
LTAGAVGEGRGAAGGTLTTTDGVWSTARCPADGYDYQWQRSTYNGTAWSAWTNIAGSADAPTYSPVAADVEARVRAQVLGCNGYGCSAWTNDSDYSTIYESALGVRRQYTGLAPVSIDDQESLQVNAANGDLVLQAKDFALPGIAGFGYKFTRTYNGAYSTLSASAALSNPNPLLAPSWEDVANLSFFNVSPGPNTGDARYTDSSGYEITFPKNGSSFTSPPGSDATLVQSDGTYLVTFYKTGMKQRFNATGQLIDEYDRNGNTIAFTWSSGQLQSVYDTTGRTTTFHYTSGNMTSITAPGNCTGPGALAGTASTSGGSLASATYYYEVTPVSAAGEWTASTEISKAVTGPTGKVTLTWTAVSGATSYRIYRGTTSGGENTYYTSSTTSYTDTGATGTSASPPAQSGTCLYRYGYTSGKLTSYADPASKQATSYAYNASGLLQTVTNPLGTQWTIAYDSQSRVTSITRALDRFAAPTATAATSGGSLATGTYYFEVSAIAGGKEVLLSAEQSKAVTGPNGKVTLTWSAVPGAASYRVYRGTTSGGENKYHATTSTSYTDTGSGTTGSLPQSRTTFAYAGTDHFFVYCDPGMQTTVTDPNGNVTKYCTDGRARVFGTLDPFSHVTFTDYTDTTFGGANCVASGETLDDQPCATMDQRNYITQYGYDPTGENRMWQENSLQAASSAPSTWAFDDLAHPNLPTSVADSDGHTTHYAYTTAGNVDTKTDGAGYTTKYCYSADCTSDGNGELLTERSGLLLDTQTHAVTCPSGTPTPICPTTEYKYDSRGNRTRITVGLGDLNRVTTYGFDAAGHPTTETDGLTLDGSQNAVCASGTTCPVTSTTYDAVGRVLTVTHPDLDTMQNTYDANGNRTNQTDGLSYDSTTQTYYCASGDTCPSTGDTYSVANALLTETDDDGTTTYYTYDASGNEMTETVGSDGIPTQYGYDALNRMTSMQDDPSCATGACPELYTYDADGDMLTDLGADGYETTYSYDHADQLTQEVDGLSYDSFQHAYVCASGDTCPTTTNAYDLAGNQTSELDGAVSNSAVSQTVTSYDGDNRASGVHSGLDSSGQCPTGSVCPLTSYTFDNNGNPATVTGPDMKVTQYTYNDANQVSTAASGLTGSGTPPTYSCAPGDSCMTTTSTYDNVGNDITDQTQGSTVVTVVATTTNLPDGGTESDYAFSDGWTLSVPTPPAGFDPLTASASQLDEYDFPARPTDSTELSDWTAAMSNYQSGSDLAPDPSLSFAASTPASVAYRESKLPYSNWAGYVMGTPNGTKRLYDGAQATVTVPDHPGTCALDNNGNSNGIGIWIGLGGTVEGKATLAQMGVECGGQLRDKDGNTYVPSKFAPFAEFTPAPPLAFCAKTDWRFDKDAQLLMKMKWERNKKKMHFFMQWTNPPPPSVGLTGGCHWTQTTNFGPNPGHSLNLSTAEFIVEAAPGDNPDPLHFSPVSFGGAFGRVYSDDHVAKLFTKRYHKRIEGYDAKQYCLKPSSPGTDKKSFQVNWHDYTVNGGSGCYG